MSYAAEGGLCGYRQIVVALFGRDLPLHEVAEPAEPIVHEALLLGMQIGILVANNDGVIGRLLCNGGRRKKYCY